LDKIELDLDKFEPISLNQKTTEPYESVESMQAPSGKPGMLESALRGGGQGLSLGTLEEAIAGAKTPFSDKTYEQLRTEERELHRLARKENPVSYNVGEFGAPILAAILTRGKVKPASFAKTFKTGTLLGGLSGAGYSEAENISDLAKDIAGGSAIGAAFPVAMRGAQETIKALKPAADYVVRKLTTGFTGKTEEFLDALIKNPKAVERIENKFGGDIKKEILPELNTTLFKFMQANPYGQKAQKLSAQAIQQIPDDAKISRKLGINVIDEALKEVRKDPLSLTGKEAEKILLGYRERMLDLNGKIPGTQMKVILQRLDDDIVDKLGGYGNPYQNSMAAKGIKQLRHSFDQELKSQAPEYAKTMARVAKNTEAAEDLTKRFAVNNKVNYKQIETFTNDLLKRGESAAANPDVAKDIKRLQVLARKESGANDPLANILQTMEDLQLKKSIEARGNQGSNIGTPVTMATAALGTTFGAPFGTIGAGIGGSLGAALGTPFSRQLEQKGGRMARNVMERTAGLRTPSAPITPINPATQIGATVAGSNVLNNFLTTQQSEVQRKKAMEQRKAK